MSKTKQILNSLNKPDIYSLLLFSIYKLKDSPHYSTLSELAYVLDKDSLLKFLDYYQGQTITIPTKKDLKEVINALVLYEQVNINGIEFKEALSKLDSDINIAKIKKIYIHIIEILDNYNFKRI